MSSYVVVIPARWKSSRFPGKPLADLAGKPVLQHVYERVASTIAPDLIFVATDDTRIASACDLFGAQAILTSENCQTGTDRIAEVASRISSDWFVNVQGDEPFVDPQAVRQIIGRIKGDGSVAAYNAISSIQDEDDFRSLTVPKVVVDRNGRILYLSRSPIPLTKSGAFRSASRQVGLYAFSKKSLEYYGAGTAKSELEEIEDIEILRLIESGVVVQSVNVESPGPAIDTPADLGRARELIAQRGES
jgi:3-deoxy-manno-octulosonate cytidylyltransferase (CMP-KDO synthetase)